MIRVSYIYILTILVLFSCNTNKKPHEMTDEEKLALVQDSIKKYHKTEEERVEEAVAEFRKKRDLERGQKRGEILKTIKENPEIKELILKDDTLTQLPDEIWALRELEILDLRGLKLKTLPAEIANLKQLKELYLFNNKLEELPTEIGELQNLEVLYLGGNRLTSLPDELKNLDQLKILTIDYNRLQTFPEAITELGSLKELRFGNNQIKKIPATISKLKGNIEIFGGIRQNQITKEHMLVVMRDYLPGCNFVDITPERLARDLGVN